MPTTPSPVNGLGQSNAEVLAQTRIYSGEVLSAFSANTVMTKFVMKKTLTSGLSMEFPITGVGKKEDVKTHIAGTDIEINTTNADTVVIPLNALEYDSAFIDNKQKKVLHWDITAPVTKKLGTSLAQKLDYTLAGLLPVACKTLGKAGQPNGSYIGNVDIGNMSLTAEQRGNALISQIHLANAKMDENNVPAEGRIFITTAMDWYDISQATKTRSKDYTTKNGGEDSFSFEVIYIGNTMCIKSNNLTLTNNYRGFLFHSDAIGLVELISPITESNYLPLKFGNLITARYCYGAGILNAGLVVGVRNSVTPIP